MLAGIFYMYLHIPGRIGNRCWYMVVDAFVVEIEKSSRLEKAMSDEIPVHLHRTSGKSAIDILFLGAAMGASAYALMKVTMLEERVNKLEDMPCRRSSQDSSQFRRSPPPPPPQPPKDESDSESEVEEEDDESPPPDSAAPSTPLPRPKAEEPPKQRKTRRSE